MPDGIALLPRLVAGAMTGWGSIMDKRLRRAPDAEWVLMCRLGLGQQRIPTLVCVPPATAGYHLVIARRQDHWATQSSSDFGGRFNRLRAAVIAHAVDTAGGHPGVRTGAGHGPRPRGRAENAGSPYALGQASLPKGY